MGARPVGLSEDGAVTSGLDEAMARVGDRWTLLVVDALLEGPPPVLGAPGGHPPAGPQRAHGPAPAPRG